MAKTHKHALTLCNTLKVFVGSKILNNGNCLFIDLKILGFYKDGLVQ
jgi:hypothetical protein